MLIGYKVFWCFVDRSDPLYFSPVYTARSMHKHIFSLHTQNRHLADIHKIVFGVDLNLDSDSLSAPFKEWQHPLTKCDVVVSDGVIVVL